MPWSRHVRSPAVDLPDKGDVPADRGRLGITMWGVVSPSDAAIPHRVKALWERVAVCVWDS